MSPYTERDQKDPLELLSKPQLQDFSEYAQQSKNKAYRPQSLALTKANTNDIAKHKLSSSRLNYPLHSLVVQRKMQCLCRHHKLTIRGCKRVQIILILYFSSYASKLETHGSEKRISILETP